MDNSLHTLLDQDDLDMAPPTHYANNESVCQPTPVLRNAKDRLIVHGIN